jgi:hypothetical protein
MAPKKTPPPRPAQVQAPAKPAAAASAGAAGAGPAKRARESEEEEDAYEEVADGLEDDDDDLPQLTEVQEKALVRKSLAKVTPHQKKKFKVSSSDKDDTGGAGAADAPRDSTADLINMYKNSGFAVTLEGLGVICVPKPDSFFPKVKQISSALENATGNLGLGVPSEIGLREKCHKAAALTVGQSKYKLAAVRGPVALLFVHALHLTQVVYTGDDACLGEGGAL